MSRFNLATFRMHLRFKTTVGITFQVFVKSGCPVAFPIWISTRNLNGAVLAVREKFRNIHFHNFIVLRETQV